MTVFRRATVNNLGNMFSVASTFRKDARILPQSASATASTMITTNRAYCALRLICCHCLGLSPLPPAVFSGGTGSCVVVVIVSDQLSAGIDLGSEPIHSL